MKFQYPSPMSLLSLGLCLAFAASSSMAGTPALKVVNPSSTAATGQAVTLGYAFAPGDIPEGKSLTATADGKEVPIQVDAKAKHADGSLRHAVLTFAGDIPAGGTVGVTLAPATPATGGAAITIASVLATDFDATVKLDLGGTVYSASAKEALQAAQTGNTATAWLTGPLVSEWQVSSPLKAGTTEHPHLHVRFGIRAYAGLKSIRVEFTVENDWAYEPSPSGFTYDASLTVGSKTVYSLPGLKHTHHARWRKVYWWGTEFALDYQIDRAYLLNSGAVPFYDTQIQVAETVLSKMKTAFEPMANGDISSYMPETGAHSDIGPLPQFGAIYLLTHDLRAKACVLGNGQNGGSFQIHYRDKNKNLPVSLDDYPYMTLDGNTGDTRNPKTDKLEAFPAVSGGLSTFTPDDAHQPSIAYLPYLISGDFFFLEELQFWANWNMLKLNPGDGHAATEYRGNSQGILSHNQVRAQAWSMRTLADAAYITPDLNPLKTYFVGKLKNNIDWYTKKYVGSTSVNELGYLEDGAFVYTPYGIAPWQDAFFTYSIGHIVDMGFTDAIPFLQWKSKFVTGMLTDKGYCWLHATAYSLQVGPADKSSKYPTFGDLFTANFTSSACTGLAMDGAPNDATGYGANMQPALAAAVQSGIPHSKEAWDQYALRNPKQDYTTSPQFAVIPRGTSVSHLLRFQGTQPASKSPKRNRGAMRTDTKPIQFGFTNGLSNAKGQFMRQLKTGN